MLYFIWNTHSIMWIISSAPTSTTFISTNIKWIKSVSVEFTSTSVGLVDMTDCLEIHIL